MNLPSQPFLGRHLGFPNGCTLFLAGLFLDWTFWCLFVSFHQGVKVTIIETRYLIALKVGTQKGGIRAHLGTKFGCNTINTHKVICDYSRKIAPICCHATG